MTEPPNSGGREPKGIPWRSFSREAWCADRALAVGGRASAWFMVLVGFVALGCPQWPPLCSTLPPHEQGEPGRHSGLRVVKPRRPSRCLQSPVRGPGDYVSPVCVPE